MRSSKILAVAWESMTQRKLRTSLTTLSVVIGITAIISLASLGEGFRVTIKTQMEQGFELNVLTVMSGGILTGVPSFFVDQDVKNISKIEGVDLATPLIQKSSVKLYNDNDGKNSTALVMLAVNFTEFWDIYPDRLVFENGSLPQPIKNNTVVIGYSVEHPNESMTFAYPNQNVIIQIAFRVGEVSNSKNYTFNVAGALGKSGAAGFINFDDAIFIPLDTAKDLFQAENTDMIFVRFVNPNYSETVAEKIKDLFPARDVRVFEPRTFIEQVEAVLSMVQTFLISIASIALLVAGLGIMNIMTVSVMERTREIGIMKAIGAKSRTILTMFLTEATLIGLGGGVLGTPIGYALANVMGHFLFRFTSSMTPQRNIVTGTRSNPLTVVTPILSLEWVLGAILFAVVVSIIFGWYPARKAAKLDPLEALRYE
jgi:putative ABC transport system permease protein